MPRAAKTKRRVTEVVCDTCGDESNSEPNLPCGRDLSEERDEPDGTTICTGTYRAPGLTLVAHPGAADRSDSLSDAGFGYCTACGGEHCPHYACTTSGGTGCCENCSGDE